MQRFAVFIACVFALSAQAQTAGTLRVQSTPTGAGVVIDGVVQRRVTTPIDVAVPAGRHLLRVGLGGYAAFEDSVTVRAGETTTVVARLVQLSGQLALDLPPGATATVNGEPYVAPLVVPGGLADVAIAAPGQPLMRRLVPVGPTAETTVGYDARRFRIARAGLAVFGPGILQATDGRPGRGALFGALALGGALTAAVMTVRASTADADNREAQVRYDLATTEAEAVAAREDIEQQVGIVRSSRQVRGGALVVGGLVYAVSLIDAFAHHVSSPALTIVQRPAASVSVTMTGSGAGIALHF